MSPDLIRRGVYQPNPAGSAIFIGLRTLDPFIQYQLLANGYGASLLTKLGLHALPSFGLLSLSHLPLPSQILLSMSAVATTKHVFWLLLLSKEEFTPALAGSVGIYNGLMNTINSLLLVATASSAALVTPSVQIPGTLQSVSLPIAVGVALFTVGILTETVAEVQRKTFKDGPANKGKICTTGLWGWARHINYGGYALWRTGYALAAGSWPAAVVIAAWHAWTFGAMSIPEIDGYMGKRYAEQWKKYRADVPYVLLPGIY